MWACEGRVRVCGKSGVWVCGRSEGVRCEGVWEE